MIEEKSDAVKFLEDAEQTFWKEKFSGRMVELLDFEYLFDDRDWTENWEPMGVVYKYLDNEKEEFMGFELFELNFQFLGELTRLQKVSQG